MEAGAARASAPGIDRAPLKSGSHAPCPGRRATQRRAAGREDNTMAVMELIVKGCILHVPARGFKLYLPITNYTINFTLLP